MKFSSKSLNLRQKQISSGQKGFVSCRGQVNCFPSILPTVTGMAMSLRIYELSHIQKHGKTVQCNDQISRNPCLHLTVLEVTGKTPTFQILIFSCGVTALCRTLHGRTEHYQASAVRS